MVLDGTVAFLRECLVRDRETGRGGRDLPCIDPSQDRPWKENVCIDRRRRRRRRAIPFALLHLSSPPAKGRASLPQTTERKPNLVRDPIQPPLSMNRIFWLNEKWNQGLLREKSWKAFLFASLKILFLGGEFRSCPAIKEKGDRAKAISPFSLLPPPLSSKKSPPPHPSRYPEDEGPKWLRSPFFYPPLARQPSAKNSFSSSSSSSVFSRAICPPPLPLPPLSSSHTFIRLFPPFPSHPPSYAARDVHLPNKNFKKTF